MNCKNVAPVIIVVAAIVSTAHAQGVRAPSGQPDLAGRWTLNRQLSQFPTDVGFGMDLAAGAGSRSSGDSGGGGRRSGGGGGTLPAGAYFQESIDDAKRRELLVNEVANPPAHLAITQTDSSVTIADDRGRSRTFHANGKEESFEIEGVGIAETARWDSTGLEVRYKVEPYRELHYTYSRASDPPRLVVQVRFVESGGHDVVTRVYEPTKADEAALPAQPTAPRPPEGLLGAAARRGGAAGTAAAPAPPAQPSNPAGQATPPPLGGTVPMGAVEPDAALKGLANIGVVVEDLSSQAAACGLTQAPIEAAVSKSLSDAGLKVLRNSDEDTYVYVDIMTSSVSPSLCVSRYDVFLYTHTTATLPYQAKPVLVQVMLLHERGMTGGAPTAHRDAVMRGVRQYVDEFAKRIRDANR